VPGVHAFLREARAAGLRLALATGSDRPKLQGNLDAIGLGEDTFEVVVSAEHITRKKPDPETFLAAIGRLGLPASRCLVVEDARNGVLAGRAAGCDVLGITTTLPAEVLLGAGARATAPDFTAVPPEIREALGLA
jgi:HAD superfamily hydrolase (TIGR01509 family)